MDIKIYYRPGNYAICVKGITINGVYKKVVTFQTTMLPKKSFAYYPKVFVSLGLMGEIIAFVCGNIIIDKIPNPKFFKELIIHDYLYDEENFLRGIKIIILTSLKRNILDSNPHHRTPFNVKLGETPEIKIGDKVL